MKRVEIAGTLFVNDSAVESVVNALTHTVSGLSMSPAVALESLDILSVNPMDSTSLFTPNRIDLEQFADFPIWAMEHRTSGIILSNGKTLSQIQAMIESTAGINKRNLRAILYIPLESK